jgi:hypothetical protein
MGREAQAGEGGVMVEAWVALAWIVTVALIPFAVWFGINIGKMQEQDAARLSRSRVDQLKGNAR